MASLAGALFVGLLIVFGWLVSLRILKVTSLPAAIGGSFTFGPAAYTVLINALGYVLPIQSAFLGGVVILGIIILLLLTQMLRAKAPLFPAVETPSPAVMWILGGVGFLGALATARFLTSDPWVWSYLPLSATIQAGNFPVMEPANPWSLAGYHYGPQLFAAAFSSLTGLSIAAGFNVQPFFGALGGLFFASALVCSITGEWRGSLLAPLLCFMAGSLVWLNGIFLAKDVMDHFILGQTIISPFRWLAPMFANTPNPSMLVIFGSRSYTFGFPFLCSILYTLQQCFGSRGLRACVPWIVVAIILSLMLSLCAETMFVLLLPALFIYVIMIRFFLRDSREKSRSNLQRIALIGFAIFIPAAVLSIMQGGLLTTTFFQPHVGGSPMYFSFDGRIRIDSPGSTLALWEPAFWVQLGLPFLLVPAVMVYWWRQRNLYPFAMFIVFLGLLHLVIPFTVRYMSEENQFMRFLHTGLSLTSFLLGLMLVRTWWASRLRWKKILASALIVCMLLSSSVYLVVRLVLPNMRWDPSAPLFAPMPAITQEQAALYAWVRAHTTLNDYFYIRTVKGHPYYLPEMTALQPDRILFMANTGRYAVGFLMWGNYAPDIRAAGEAVEERCDPEGLRTLQVRYLLLEDEERNAWFQKHCPEKDWVLRYRNVERGMPLIYEWKQTDQ